MTLHVTLENNHAMQSSSPSSNSNPPPPNSSSQQESQQFYYATLPPITPTGNSKVFDRYLLGLREVTSTECAAAPLLREFGCGARLISVGATPPCDYYWMAFINSSSSHAEQDILGYHTTKEKAIKYAICEAMVRKHMQLRNRETPEDNEDDSILVLDGNNAAEGKQQQHQPERIGSSKPTAAATNNSVTAGINTGPTAASTTGTTTTGTTTGSSTAPTSSTVQDSHPLPQDPPHNNNITMSTNNTNTNIVSTLVAAQQQQMQQKMQQQQLNQQFQNPMLMTVSEQRMVMAAVAATRNLQQQAQQQQQYISSQQAGEIVRQQRFQTRSAEENLRNKPHESQMDRQTEMNGRLKRLLTEEKRSPFASALSSSSSSFSSIPPFKKNKMVSASTTRPLDTNLSASAKTASESGSSSTAANNNNIKNLFPNFNLTYPKNLLPNFTLTHLRRLPFTSSGRSRDAKQHQVKHIIELVNKADDHILVCFRGFADTFKALGVAKATVQQALLPQGTTSATILNYISKSRQEKNKFEEQAVLLQNQFHVFSTFYLRYGNHNGHPSAYEYGAHPLDLNLPSASTASSKSTDNETLVARTIRFRETYATDFKMRQNKQQKYSSNKSGNTGIINNQQKHIIHQYNSNAQQTQHRILLNNIPTASSIIDRYSKATSAQNNISMNPQQEQIANVDTAELGKAEHPSSGAFGGAFLLNTNSVQQQDNKFRATVVSPSAPSTESACILCQESKAQVIFMPCFHCILCSTCCERFNYAPSYYLRNTQQNKNNKFCPSCRVPIQSISKPKTAVLVRPKVYSAACFF